MKNKFLFPFCLLLSSLLLWSCVEDLVSYTGNIIGKVTDARTGMPLDGATVTITPGGLSRTTGSNGIFEFRDLEAKQYEIQVQKDGYVTNNKTINVTMGTDAVGDIAMTPIEEDGKLELSVSYLNFGDRSTSLSFSILNNGNKSFNWNITGLDKLNWLSVSPVSGTLAAGKSNAVTVTLNRNYITEYVEGTIIINTDNESLPLKITADVENVSSKISLSTTTLNFGTEYNTLSFDIKNIGNAGDVNWNITGVDATWIKVSPMSGTTSMYKSSVVKVDIDRSKMEVGSNSTTIIVEADGESLPLKITAEVEKISSKISLSTTTLNFGTEHTTHSFDINNIGNAGDVNWNIIGVDAAWIKVSPMSGTTSMNKSSVVKVDIDRSKMEVGSNSTTIIVEADGESLPLKITAEVEKISSKISLSTTTLNFGTEHTTHSFDINNIGNAGDVNWNIIGVDAAWIKVSPMSGTTSMNKSSVVKVDIDRNQMEVGSNSTAIIVEANGESFRVTINAEKAPNRYLEVYPSAIILGTNDSESFIVTSHNGATAYKLYGSGDSQWASFSKDEGVIPMYDPNDIGTIENITIYADRTGLAPGNYTFSLIIRTDLGDYELPVSMTVEESATPDVPSGEILTCHDDLEFTLTSCKMSGTTATIEYMVENIGNNTLELTLWGTTGGYSYVYDDQGNEYKFGYGGATLTLGNESYSSGVTAKIPSGVKVKGSIVISNVADDAASFNITLRSTFSGADLVFKNIAIQGRSSSSLDTPQTTGTVISCDDDLEFILLDCKRGAGDKVTLSYKVKNLTNKSHNLILWGSTGGRSYVYDDQGNEYRFGYDGVTLTLGSESSSSGVSTTIPPNAVAKGSVIIKGVDSSAAEMSNIAIYSGSSSAELIFKKVKIR